MTDRPVWVPEDVDITVPNPARMYDYLLGGGHNFAVDRELVDKAIPLIPNLSQMARRNRAFLRRAVLALVEAGVRQFLDIGSGIPTAGNVHEIAQRAAPESRVVYVDIDPIVELGKKSVPFYPRTSAEIGELFTGFDLIDPGLVTTAEWRGHHGADGGGDPKDDVMLAGVGIKR